jgi:hypothetical protein
MIALLLAFFTQAASPAPTASPTDQATIATEVEEVCRRVLCRNPKTVRLRLEGGKSFEMTPSAPTPIVTGDVVTVMPGETVMVEASLKDGRLVDLTAVPKVSKPQRTLVLSLTQDSSIGDGTDMVLKVESPFPVVLKYRLGMMRPSSGRLVKTSSCPLSPGKSVFEHWPHPIFQVVAADFEVVDPESEAAKRCE